ISGSLTQETDMRYALHAEASPDASSTRMAKDPPGGGAGRYRADHYDVIGNVRNLPIRIFTLGQFSIFRNAVAITSKGKAQHRPLGLLQALIALGGKDVAGSRLCECLWPDSDGDLAGRNLNITVHRLRQILQAPGVVVQRDGKLTLSSEHCTVDALHFERLVSNSIEGLGNAAMAEDAESNLHAAMGLYCGHFLALESEEPWMLAPRLRMKSKFERLVLALSRHHEQQMRFEQAVDICRRALELDPLNELLYRCLMGCYLKQGEIARALDTYVRCREALAKGLSAAVSCETARLYVQVLREAQNGNHHSYNLAAKYRPHV
ncbi:MAG TPA: BTAD domain-containing putative transcriptional regulator, partial [Burkholderiales bacterium]|nr:BTAD domain-containing putative transcriptional regulator [Burkholderiales bacterium]